MNSLEPFFQSLDKLIDSLTKMGSGGMGETSVQEILGTAKAIAQIGEECEGFRVMVLEELGEKASARGKESDLQGVQAQLLEIVAQCKGEAATSLPVKDLIKSVGRWRESFLVVFEEIEAAEAPQTYQQLHLNLKQLQTDVLGSEQLETSLKLELIKNLFDLENRLQPNGNWEQLAPELDRVRSKFHSAIGQPVPAPSLQQPPFSVPPQQVTPEPLEAQLRQIQPKASDAIRTAVKIQEQVTKNGNHEDLVNAIERLESQGVLSATWLKAVFLYSYLKVACSRSEPPSEVFNYLISNSQKWLTAEWNVQAVAIRARQSLEEFSDSHPSLLSLHDIYEFFSSLGPALSHNPHYFRLEIILSRLCLDLAKLNSPSSEYFQKALSHAERALNLKPKLVEATDLKQLAMFFVEFEVQWGDNDNYRQEGGLDGAVPRKTIEDVIRQPAIAKLEKLHNLLKTAKPWCAFAFFDCLSKQEPDNQDVLWYRALSAKQLKRKSDYFESALPCLNRVAAANPAIVAKDLLSMELYGLALAVAVQENDSASLDIGAIVDLAAQKCQLQPWEWPLLLQKALEKFQIYSEDENWVDAASLIIRTLAHYPTNWASCIAFLDIFTRPSDDREQWGNMAIELAIAVLRYLTQQPRFQEQPELLVLEAELRFHQGSQDNRLLSDAVRSKCEELCRRSHQGKGTFAPAMRLHERLTPKLVTLAPGETFNNRYRIVEAMPVVGSVGQVYKAEDIDDNGEKPKFVALKQVRADAATSEKLQHCTRLLEQEAEIAKRLKHDHIVGTYDFIKDHKCLVMEFINGETLWNKIQNRVSLPWKSAAQIGHQITEALRYAGEIVDRDFGNSNFAHRDIHPGNIMVMGTTENPHAKLLDFGLARLPGGLSTTVVFEGVDRHMIYRPPEYGKKMDFRGDMFALGVILYELIAGECPYPADKYSEYKHDMCSGSEVAQSLRPLRKLLSPGIDVPQKLEYLLLKMVAFNKDKRYKSYSELMVDFGQLLQ